MFLILPVRCGEQTPGRRGCGLWNSTVGQSMQNSMMPRLGDDQNVHARVDNAPFLLTCPVLSLQPLYRFYCFLQLTLLSLLCYIALLYCMISFAISLYQEYTPLIFPQSQICIFPF